MGLLDALMTGKFTDDPEQNAAMQQGLLQFGLNLMSRPGGLAQALGQSGLAAMQGVNQYKQQQFQGKLQKEQLADIERRRKQQAAEDEMRQAIPSPQLQSVQAALSGGGGPSMANAQRMAPVDPMATLRHSAMRAGIGGVPDYINSLQKDDALIKGSPGDVFFTKGGQQKFAVPAQEKEPEDIKKLKMIYGDGTPAYRRALEQLGAKVTTHQPAANIKIDNKLGEGLAKEVGPMIADSASRAQGAQQQISNAETIIRAVDTNRLYAGPGANIRLKGAQIGQMLGVGGKDAAEAVANTRSVIQGLARATVAARGALKGQGQVSDFEGKLLAKAESGDIEDMTPAEIRYIASKNKEYGTKLIEQHGQLIKKAKGNQSTSGIADFFDVPPAQGQTLDWGALPNGR